MMVMISAFGNLGRPAQSVLSLTVARVHDIGSSEFGEQIQPAIHRGEADTLTPAPQFGVHVLGRAKAVCVNQHRVDRIGLTRVTHPASTRAAHYGISSSQRHDRSSRQRCQVGTDANTVDNSSHFVGSRESAVGIAVAAPATEN
jgi:hypothetical protein